MNFAFFITYISYFIIMPIFGPSLFPIIFMLIGTMIVVALITKYLPLKQIENEDIAFVLPTKVNFEKTDDVNTNIKRYREAIKKAKEARLDKKTNKILKWLQ
ncbi:hypothetical protein [Kangiella sediminilitoris]|nr:hypothetical protein [Kangiella sediminilitoris]